MALGADVNQALVGTQLSNGKTTSLDYVRLLREKIADHKKAKVSQPEHSGGGHLKNLVGRNIQAEDVVDKPSSWKVEVYRIVSECKSIEAKDTTADQNQLPLDKIDAYCSDVENLLVAHDAKCGRDLLSPEELKNTGSLFAYPSYVPNIPMRLSYVPVIRDFGGLTAQFFRHVGSWGYSALPGSLDSLYDELYTACFEGDNLKIQQLCMPRGHHKRPDTPLQISSHWGNNSAGTSTVCFAYGYE